MGMPTTIGECAREPTTDLASLETRLPTELRPLARLAFNYWWSWQSGGPDLFRALDPCRWEACGENPVRLLEEISPAALQCAARDAALTTRIANMESLLARDLSRPSTTIGAATSARPIAFVCAEYAVHASLPIYAGGLGVLAGDYIKEASDRAIPLVAVGIFYRRGYFHQRLDPSGWQHEAWSVETAERLPITLATDASGAPVRIRVPIRGREVFAQIWRVNVGRVPLFLLDTDVPENGRVERWISAQLYVGDNELRLMQYALLGIGGMRALRALGIEPAIVHLNEGHAALATLELLRAEMNRGAGFDAAVAAVRERVVFTTHTPVAAGNERFDRGQLDRIVDWAALGVDGNEAFALGRAVGENAGFGMTELALRTSRSANGVSRRHGEVARAMWQPLFARRSVEETPIRYVTNGVHPPTWMAQPMRDLLTRHLGDGWESAVADPTRWVAVDAIPDKELWAVRSELRASLVAYEARSEAC
jgi:starch phosphorylase